MRDVGYPDSYKKRASNTFKALVHYYFRNEKRQITLEDKPYINFLSCIHEYVYKLEYYDSDLMEFVVEESLSKMSEIPDKVEFSMVESLIDDVIETFKINADEHYLIIPAPKAGLNVRV